MSCIILVSIPDFSKDAQIHHCFFLFLIKIGIRDYHRLSVPFLILFVYYKTTDKIYTIVNVSYISQRSPNISVNFNEKINFLRLIEPFEAMNCFRSPRMADARCIRVIYYFLSTSDAHVLIVSSVIDGNLNGNLKRI